MYCAEAARTECSGPLLPRLIELRLSEAPWGEAICLRPTVFAASSRARVCCGLCQLVAPTGAQYSEVLLHTNVGDGVPLCDRHEPDAAGRAAAWCQIVHVNTQRHALLC